MKPTHLCTLHLSHRLVHTVPLCRLDGVRTNVQTLHNNRRRVRGGAEPRGESELPKPPISCVPIRVKVTNHTGYHVLGANL